MTEREAQTDETCSDLAMEAIPYGQVLGGVAGAGITLAALPESTALNAVQTATTGYLGANAIMTGADKGGPFAVAVTYGACEAEETGRAALHDLWAPAPTAPTTDPWAAAPAHTAPTADPWAHPAPAVTHTVDHPADHPTAMAHGDTGSHPGGHPGEQGGGHPGHGLGGVSGGMG